jgi:hypothetical protein
MLALQRVLLVTLLAPVILIAATAAIPAHAMLPFLPGGIDRAVKLISAYTAYARTLLSVSRPDPPALRPESARQSHAGGTRTRAAPPMSVAQRPLRTGQRHRLGQRTAVR